MRYYIADLHFFHAALNDHMDYRGFASVEEMNEYMITKWNGKVRKNDDVIIILTNLVLGKHRGNQFTFKTAKWKTISYSGKP